MSNPYANWIDAWERRLATRDTNRKVLPFEWGTDWLAPETPPGEPGAWVAEYARRAVAASEDFFASPTPQDFTLADDLVTFTSPLATPYEENNKVHAGLFRASQDRGRAVLVLPQWNSDALGHVALCRLLNRFGLTALRMSMAYHDRRLPNGHDRADFHVSPNVGRTIHACRQSVIDARACLDWLAGQGYRRLGIVGTSLGSCVAFITAAHDARVRAGVYNHVSTYFGDVVWTGLATRYVRQGFGQAITQDQLREFWRPISPATYVGRMAKMDSSSLLIWARHDTTFLPEYSKQFISLMFQTGCRCRAVCLPCAHYTTGEFPFKYLDAFLICRFLAAQL